MNEIEESKVPAERVRRANDAAVRTERDYVLYWMTTARRARSNFALERAADWSRALSRPLVVLEALRVDYEYASDRHHRFVIDGMEVNARAFAKSNAVYLPYVEPAQGAGKGLLVELARRAAVVVGDDYPAFFLPRMLDATALQLDVRLELVDGNGLLPMRVPGRSFPSAYVFRRYLQKTLPLHLHLSPTPNPLLRLPPAPAEILPASIRSRWSSAKGSDLAMLPIDHDVAPADGIRGGSDEARKLLTDFVNSRLKRYELRSHPDDDASSGLSPYLHFGQVGAHEVFAAVAETEDWSDGRLSREVNGKRSGFWGMSENAEGFLDQLVTWRELGFNACVHESDLTTLAALPNWARKTLDKHRADPRPYLYPRDQLARGETHDPLWNAAQRELREHGRMHNYLRMLWGKNIVLWSESPEVALDVMFELNDRYALDGRDPNSISGILWVLGRYDRAWGPEREVLGSVRYMTSKSAMTKLRLGEYLALHGDATQPD